MHLQFLNCVVQALVAGTLNRKKKMFKITRPGAAKNVHELSLHQRPLRHRKVGLGFGDPQNNHFPTNCGSPTSPRSHSPRWLSSDVLSNQGFLYKNNQSTSKLDNSQLISNFPCESAMTLSWDDACRHDYQNLIPDSHFRCMDRIPSGIRSQKVRNSKILALLWFTIIFAESAVLSRTSFAELFNAALLEFSLSK